MSESRYEFKGKLLRYHKNDILDAKRVKGENQFEIKNGFTVILPNDNEVVYTAAKDLVEFLYISMGVSSMISKSGDIKNNLVIKFNSDIEEASGYMGYRITANEGGILIEGYDDRGIMQGIYFLEDMMKMAKAPFIDFGVIKRKARFRGRISNSPLGMTDYSSETFSLMSHYGLDTVSLWAGDLNMMQNGNYIDMPTICETAKKYGIDVLIQLSAPHSFHPSDTGAEEFYDKLYGKFFDTCPYLKGIILVGECTEFPSKDPKAGLSPRRRNFVDNIPTGKCTPGWWPCSDYPEWVALIRKVIKNHKSDAEVYFSTYNWGYAPKEDRIALLKKLPKDVIVLSTWDMFEQIKVGNSTEDIVDYSLRFIGPGKYFESEAESAKKLGLRVSCNCNASGKTWDFGVIPYEPAPTRWLKRYKRLIENQERLGIYGTLENIHYAFYPSIVTDLEKYAFFTGGKDLDEYLEDLIVRDYGKENLKTVKSAFLLVDEALSHYPPTNEDMYGAFRIGPAYPLWLSDPRLGLTPFPGEGKKPDEFKCIWGNSIYFPFYTQDVAGRNSLPGVRIYDEINDIKEMANLLNQSVKEFTKVKNPNRKLKEVLHIVEFMYRSSLTAINEKTLFINMQKLSVIGDKKEAEKILNQVEKLLIGERENVKKTFPLIEEESILGYEPSMEYTTDENGLNWKLRQLDHELKFTLPKFKKSNSL